MSTKVHIISREKNSLLSPSLVCYVLKDIIIFAKLREVQQQATVIRSAITPLLLIQSIIDTRKFKL